MLKRVASEWFGDFDRQELKKFIFLGVIFGFVIGIYWVLKPVKDAVFMSMVGAKKIGHAKIFSLIALFPAVMILGKLIDMFPRHRILYVLGCIYSFLRSYLGFSWLIPPLGYQTRLSIQVELWVGCGMCLLKAMGLLWWLHFGRLPLILRSQNLQSVVFRWWYSSGNFVVS